MPSPLHTLSTLSYAPPLTPATIVSPKQLPHGSLLPLHLCASSLAAPPQQHTAAVAMPQPLYPHPHSASAPSLPALLLSSANNNNNNHHNGAASIFSSSLPSSFHPPTLSSLPYGPSTTTAASSSMSSMSLSSAFDLTSSICRSKQRLARKAELARQSRKRKKSAIAHMADTIRQLKDDNARLRQKLAHLGVHDDANSGRSGSSSKRKSSHRAAKLQHSQKQSSLQRTEDGELSEQDDEALAVDYECPSELTNSSDEGEEGDDDVLPGAADLAALSPSSTPSSVASSLLSAASSMDLPLTALIGKRGRT